MPFLLLLFGFLPFAAGGLLNRIMWMFPDFFPPMSLIGILFLLFWGALAHVAFRRIQSIGTVTVLLNLVPLIVLILLGVQELVLGAYWFNAIGAWTQYFYLPLLTTGFTLTMWAHSVFPAYCAAFLLMVAVSVIGCISRKN